MAAKVEIRRLGPADRAAFQAFVRGLAPESRRRRFHSPVTELSPAALDAFTRPDQLRHVAYAALRDGQLVGEARYVRLGAGGRAEFALAVADDWQRQGFGARLLGALLREARIAGLAALEGEVLRDNAPMLALLGRSGFRLGPCPGDARLLLAERILDPLEPARKAA